MIQKTHFEDEHIRFVEYTLHGGENRLPALAYHSVLMTDAVWPDAREELATGESHGEIALPPDGRAFPWSCVDSPRGARTVTVNGDFPQHYYRIEYKRVDGAAYGANWRAWYSDVFAPFDPARPDLGASLASCSCPHSTEWPYDFGYNAVAAAPANHFLRFRDDHVELLEVAIREGEAENMHGHPYPSVYADDGGFGPMGSEYRNATLIPDTPPPWGNMTGDPATGPYPICFSAKPESPHSVSVIKGPPQHFYRVHFLRVDGDDVKTKWPEWYPR